MKENIVIIEATSTGANYIHDAMELGYNVICLETAYDINGMREYYDLSYSIIDEKPLKIIKAPKSYEETLEIVKEFNPICIIPGADEGIEWATQMAYDLGLPGNDPKNLKKMTDKKHMQNALKENGLRYIKSKEISTFEEAKEFIKELDGSKFVVKPSRGYSTVGVCICESDEELKNALEINSNIDLGFDSRILIQEYIGGEEFVVDSLCCQGHNKAIGTHQYKKMLIGGRGTIYNYDIALDKGDPFVKELEEYNEKVLEALGLEYGVTHGEYKIDEKGPILIEMNCRVPGPLQKYDMLDKVWGDHCTALSLESYLNPEKSLKKIDKGIEKLSHYAIKCIILYEDIFVKEIHLEDEFKDLESYEYSVSFGENRLYPKTTDFTSAGGLVFLVNDDKDKLLEDLNTIRRIEKYEVEKIFDIGHE